MRAAPLLALLAWAGAVLAQAGETADEPSMPERAGAGLVACLLPANIDRFGQQLTIVGARQTIETSRADCQARGGEVIDESGAATGSRGSTR